MPMPAMRAQWGYTYLYMCRHRAAEAVQNAIFFALLAFGFYNYHQLKYFFSETFDDVILDLWVEVLVPREYLFSNARHSVQPHQQESLSMPPPTSICTPQKYNDF